MSIKKLIFAVVALTCALFAWIFYQYWSTTKITVETSHPETYVQIIDLSNPPKESEGNVVASEKQKVSARVAPGRYQVSAYTTAFSISKTITVKARESVSIKLDPPPFSPSEPVITEGMQDPVIDAQQAMYINVETGRLMRIEGNNASAVVDIERYYKSARWLSVSHGVLQERNNGLVLYKDGAVSQISLPFELRAANTEDDHNSQSVAFDLAPNGRLYVSNGRDVYATNPAGQLTKIYSAPYDQFSLTAADSHFATVYSALAADEHMESEGPPAELSIISESGSRLASKKIRYYEANWSPDGKHLIARGNESLDIYDIKLNRVSSVPGNVIGTLAWRTSNDYIFSQGNEVWAGNISSNQASKIGRANGTTVEETALSQNGEYVYVTSTQITDENRRETFRISFIEKEVPEYLQQISVFLPETFKNCRLDYRNFSGLVVTAEYPDNGTPGRCIEIAKEEFQIYDMPVSEINFQAIPLKHD